MNDNSVLPPLPSSDPESMARNIYNGYYDIRSRDYWKDADVSLTKIEDFKKCPHYFKQEGSQVQCTRCFAGFFGGNLLVQDGKLLFNNQVVL